MNSWLKFILVTVGGLGLLPKAPGTWGSLLPLAVVLGCGHFYLDPVWTMGILVALFVVSTIVTLTCVTWYTEYFGQQDPSHVVSDEVAGQSIALLGMAWLIPPVESPVGWIGFAVLAFVCFRVLDIWKPSLIGRSQQLHGGIGVVVDDILAGVIAGVIIFGLTLLSH